MAKLRRNHSSDRSGFGSMIFRVILFIILCGMAFVWLYNSFSNFDFESTPTSGTETERFYLPTGSEGQLVSHSHYSLSYNDSHEQAEWVAYRLTRESLRAPNVPRAKEFRTDPLVRNGSARHNDYTRTGYTRGHLAPAGDMAFSREAMQESFYMSNISPMIRPFNNGIWRELEENVRDWAYSKEYLYVICGPVLDQKRFKQIGNNDVSVPTVFYKILLDETSGDNWQAVGFLIPHKKSDKHLRDYMVPVDEIERITGLDFFSDLLNDDVEEKIESTFNQNHWKLSERRYEMRVEEWNDQ